MKAKRPRQGRQSERRRDLAELNLLSEHKAKSAPTRSRGCGLPFIGSGLTLLVGGAAVLVALAVAQGHLL